MRNLMPTIDTPDGVFHDGNPATGAEGTIVTATWTNDAQASVRDIQAEMITVLAMADMQPNPQKQNQLAEAIRQILGSGDYVTHPYLKLELMKKVDKADIAQQLGNDPAKVASQQLVTTELGKKAGVADVNGKLAKDQNGADIPDKQKFAENLGLPEKFQPKGNYADGDRFSTRTSAVLMLSPNGKYGVEIGNTGMFGVTDLSGAAPVPIFRVMPTGEINDGAIALAKVTGAGTAAKSDILQTTGTSTANVMSQKAVTDAVAAIKVFGAGQRWSDVKNTRNLGVNYTNTSGRTIALFASTVPATSPASSVIYVDGVTVSNSAIVGSDSGFTRMASGSAIISPGSTYRVEANSLDKWSELR